jgi:RecA/RadA recombinase
MSDEINEGSETKNFDEEIFKNIQLKDADEPKEEKVSKRKKLKAFVKAEEVLEDVGSSEELYADFKNFLQKKTDIVPETQDFKQTMSSGLDLLDAILGGGFAIGALNIIVGQPGSGKSMLAIQSLASGQRQYKGKLLGSYLDSEESTSKVRLMNLGVKYPPMNPYVDITVEKVFQFIEGMCVFKQEREILDVPSVIIWDSIANTLSQKEREAEDPKSVIGYKARMLSLLIPTYVAKCSKNNICLLAINQLRDNLQMGQFAPAPDLKMLSSNKEMPGGNALKFNAFQLLEMKVRSVLNPEKHYGFDGIMSKVKCVKNKMFSPNIEIDLIGSFQNGFSNFWTNYHFLNENKRINTGAWNTLVNLAEKKYRKQEAEALYNTDAEFKAAFDELAKKTIEEEIIEKYK